MTEENKQPEVQVNTQKTKELLDKIVEAKGLIESSFKTLTEDEKKSRAIWRPIEKEVTILFLKLRGTFFLERDLEETKKQTIAQLKQQTDAQEKMK